MGGKSEGKTKAGKTNKGGGKAAAGSGAKGAVLAALVGGGAAKGTDKGAGKGRGNSAGKGKEQGKSGKGKSSNTRAASNEGGNATEASQGGALCGARTVQEIEAAIFTAKIAVKSPSSGRQPLEAKGSHCEVKKHSEMGCAVVTMESTSAREAINTYYVAPRTVTSEDGKKGRAQIQIGDHTAQVRPHIDKDSKEEIKTDFFLAWGHKSEKLAPLSADSIAQAFDQLYLEAWNAIASGAVQASASPAPILQPNVAMGSPLAASQVAAPQGYFDFAAAAAAFAQHMQVAAVSAQQQGQAQQMQQQPHDQQGCQTPPPRALGGDSQPGLRADAPSFMYGAPQDAYAAYTDFGAYQDAAAAAYPPAPERKPLTIVNPKSGQPIEVEPLKTQPELSPPKAPGRKTLAIIDPSSGSTVDAVGFNFSPPKQAKPLSIIDPTSGSRIEV